MKKRWLAAILVVMLLLVQAVALAGGEGECEHEWEWWASDTHHWQKCEKCNESKDEAPHNMSFDDTKNLYVCSVCGHECDHEHDFSGDWVKDGVDHWHVCKHKDCDAIDGYKRHTMVSDGEGYKCSECGYTRNHEKHQFDKYGFNGSGHWRKCSVKGCGVEDPDSYEEHSFEEDAENGYRCKCGFTTDHKEHQWGEWVAYDDAQHCRYCEHEGCDEYQMGDHQWENNADGTSKCTDCGYSRHSGEHEWSDWKPGIYVHWKECKIEGCLSTYEEEHQFDADARANAVIWNMSTCLASRSSSLTTIRNGIIAPVRIRMAISNALRVRMKSTNLSTVYANADT